MNTYLSIMQQPPNQPPNPAQTSQLAPAAAPQTTAQLEALVAKRGELGQQLQNVTERRRVVAEQRGQATTSRDLTARLTVLDDRSARLEREILQADDAIADALARGIAREATGADALFKEIAASQGSTIQPPPRPSRAREAIANFPLFEALGLVLVGLALYHWVWRRGQAKVARVSPDQSRFDQLQQSVDVIALEVERISEGQRYVAKMLSENFQPAIGAGEAQPLPAKQKVGAPAHTFDEPG